jgi:hypothetical protein
MTSQPRHPGITVQQAPPQQDQTTSCIRGPLTESNRSKSTNHKVKQKQSYLSQTFSNYVVHLNIFELGEAKMQIEW